MDTDHFPHSEHIEAQKNPDISESILVGIEEIQNMFAKNNYRIPPDTQATFEEICQELDKTGKEARRSLKLLKMDISTIVELAGFSIDTQESYQQFIRLLQRLEESEDISMPSWWEMSDLAEHHTLTFAYRPRYQDIWIHSNFPDGSSMKLWHIDTTTGVLHSIPQSERVVDTSGIIPEKQPQMDTPERFLLTPVFQNSVLFQKPENRFSAEKVAHISEVLKNENIHREDLSAETKEEIQQIIRSGVSVDSPERFEWFTRLVHLAYEDVHIPSYEEVARSILQYSVETCLAFYSWDDHQIVFDDIAVIQLGTIDTRTGEIQPSNKDALQKAIGAYYQNRNAIKFSQQEDPSQEIV